MSSPRKRGADAGNPTLAIIYLDNNATTQPSAGVIAAMTDALRVHWHNPSSVHRAGQAARQQVELARQAVADLIGAKAREITFTSGGTEAIDMAIRGVLGALPVSRRGLVTTRIEHAAVRDLSNELVQEGAGVTWAGVTRDGVVDLDDLRRCIVPGTGLVSIQWANNETGAVQPIDAVYALCREKSVLFHCDGTQWVGKMPVMAPPCDLLTCAPHKFHGPKGVGVLWARAGVRLRPQLLGTQELGRRGGTENVPGIVGAGVAAEETLAWLGDHAERVRLGALRDRFEGLVRELVPGCVVNGVGKGDKAIPGEHSTPEPLRDQERPNNPPPFPLPPGGGARLWNTTNIGFPRLEAEALLMLLSEQGVCASAGAACSSGSLDPSPVLLAMGVPDEVAHGSVRFSLSRLTTPQEVEEGAAAVARCVRRQQSSLTS